MNLDPLAIFVAGLFTIMTPCVFPLIPIYLSALIGGDVRKLEPGQRGQLLVRSFLFTLGFLIVFVALGISASTLGSFFVGHKNVLTAAGALLILLFGLKFLGWIQVGWLDRMFVVNDRRLRTRFGGLNALVMGLVFALGWSPCAGPVLGSVLTYTASRTSNPWVGASYLAIYGLGFSVPLWIGALFAQAGLGLLKKINPHLPKIEKAIGLLLLVFAGALLVDLLPRSQPSSATGAAGSATSAAAAGEPALLIFISEGCSVCQRMKPTLESLHRQCQGKKMRVEEHDLSRPEARELIVRYHLVATPTFVFLDRHGHEVSRLVGEQSESALQQSLAATFGEPCPGLGLLSDPADPRSGTPNAGCDSQAAQGTGFPSGECQKASTP